MKFVTFLSLLALLPFVRSQKNTNCTTETLCSCNAKGIGLMSLVNKEFNNKESFVEIVSSSDGNTYRFYPCGVDMAWGGDCDTTRHRRTVSIASRKWSILHSGQRNVETRTYDHNWRSPVMLQGIRVHISISCLPRWSGSIFTIF